MTEVDLLRFGTNGMTIKELFDRYYGEGLVPDPTPTEVRTRLIELEKLYYELQFEKTMCQHSNKIQVGIWNNLLTMVSTQIKITQDINISVCNEIRGLHNK